jgi:hypothetical protein
MWVPGVLLLLSILLLLLVDHGVSFLHLLASPTDIQCSVKGTQE